MCAELSLRLESPAQRSIVFSPSGSDIEESPFTCGGPLDRAGHIFPPRKILGSANSTAERFIRAGAAFMKRRKRAQRISSGSPAIQELLFPTLYALYIVRNDSPMSYLAFHKPCDDGVDLVHSIHFQYGLYSTLSGELQNID